MNQTFYEFFCGGGMARLGLGNNWQCLLANDIDPKKADTYRANFGDSEIVCSDIYTLTSSNMPGKPTLAWASFPCQDLSLAGNRSGLLGDRSSTFWGFWLAITKLKTELRAPPLIVLENVVGTLTSNNGADFSEICGALASAGYCFGAVVIDAIDFLPQSRPRLFIICVDTARAVPSQLLMARPDPKWHSSALTTAVKRLPKHIYSKWRWWNLPGVPERTVMLADLLQIRKDAKDWNSPSATKRLLEMMSAGNLAKIREAGKTGRTTVGTVYKRTRLESGERVQRAEVRFDGVAGCLRTPGGGSSRQTLVVVEGKEIRSRLLTVREAARLMGVPDQYKIPKNYNEGYHIFGDGLAVPAVRFLTEHLLTPLAAPPTSLSPIISVAAE